MKLHLSTYATWAAAYALSSFTATWSPVAAFAPAFVGPATVPSATRLSFGIDGLDELVRAKDVTNKERFSVSIIKEVSAAKTHLANIDEDNFYDGIPNEPVIHESLGGTVMVSGFEGESSSILFDLLNNAADEDPDHFAFEKIVAFSDNVDSARKVLLSRKSRYSGLLNKLDFAEASSSSSVPSAEQLEGTSSWVAHVSASDAAEVLPAIAYAASTAPSVKHVAILVDGYADEGVNAALESFASSTGDYNRTVLVTGELTSAPGGRSAYHIGDISVGGGGAGDVLPPGSILPSAEGYRMLTDCLALNAASGKILTAREYLTEVIPEAEENNGGMLFGEKSELNATEVEALTPEEKKARKEAWKDKFKAMVIANAANKTLAPEKVLSKEEEIVVEAERLERADRRLIRATREVGYSRTREFEHMITKGAKALISHIDNPQPRPVRGDKATASSDSGRDYVRPVDEPDEDPEKKRQMAEARAKRELALDWIKRRYWSIMAAGGPTADKLPPTEAEYREIMMERAQVAAAKKYDSLIETKGLELWNVTSTDEQYKTNQKKKGEVMLEKLKAKYLATILDE